MTIFLSSIVFILSCTNNKQTISPAEFKKLSTKLSYSNRYAKVEASEEIAKLGPTAIKTLSLLIKNLSAPDPMVRRYSAFAIGKLGPDTEQAIPHLINALKDVQDEVVFAAATALMEIGTSTAKKAFNDYLLLNLKLIEDTSTENRLTAAKRFGKLGKYGGAATDILAERLHYDTEDIVRNAAAEALGKIGSIDSLPALISCTQLYSITDKSMLPVDRDMLFNLNKIDFDVYALLYSGKLSFEKVITKQMSKEETLKIKSKAFAKKLFIIDSDIFFKNHDGTIIPFYKNNRPRPWAKELLIKNSNSNDFSPVPSKLFLDLSHRSKSPSPGTKIEKYNYVQQAALQAIEKITGLPPEEFVQTRSTIYQ